jgi:hypothetical protein
MRIYSLFLALFSLACTPEHPDVADILVWHDPASINSVDIEAIDANQHLIAGTQAVGYSQGMTETTQRAFDFWFPINTPPVTITIIVRTNQDNPFCFEEGTGSLEILLPDDYAVTEFTEEEQGYNRCHWQIDLAP